MTPRKRLAPNNQAVMPNLGTQFAGYECACSKSDEAPSIVTWASPGKGVNGESVNSSNPRLSAIRAKIK